MLRCSDYHDSKNIRIKVPMHCNNQKTYSKMKTAYHSDWRRLVCTKDLIQGMVFSPPPTHSPNPHPRQGWPLDGQTCPICFSDCKTGVESYFLSPIGANKAACISITYWQLSMFMKQAGLNPTPQGIQKSTGRSISLSHWVNTCLTHPYIMEFSVVKTNKSLSLFKTIWTFHNFHIHTCI